jgi:hypothetical protein
LALASRLPGVGNIDVWLARHRRSSRVLALLPVFLTLLVPATVRGDIYKWTDELGNTVVSNVRPVDSSRVSHLELLATETRPATRSSVVPSQQSATRTEQALEARIENLERQLQAQQYPQQAEIVTQPTYPVDYYPTPAPPPEPSYYSGRDPGYEAGYNDAWPLIYSTVAVPARTIVPRPPVANQPPVSAGPTPVFTGPTPVFTGPTPVLMGPTPVFVGPTPAFVSLPAAAVSSHGGSLVGGSMRR